MADRLDASSSAPWLQPVPIAAFIAPIIAAPSGRGLVPVLLIVGMWAFLDLFRRRRYVIRGIFSTQTALWALIVSGLALSSATWALVPAQSIKVGLSCAGLAIFGLVMLFQAKHQSDDESASTQTALIAGVSCAIILLAIGTSYGVMTDQPLWGKEGQHPLSTLSHAQTIIAVFLTPCLAILWDRGSKARAYGALLMAFAAVTFFHLEHSASNLAIMVAMAAFILVRTTGRTGMLVLFGAIALAMIAMPFVLSAFMPSQEALDALTQNEGGWSSENHRLHMWRFVTEAIANGSFAFGFGADASRGFPGANEKIMWGIELMPLHPHNGAIQVWLELGAIGVAIVAIAPLLILKATKDMPRHELAIHAALLSAYLVPWVLSYGIWQSWWMALAWLTAAIGRGLTAPKEA